MEVFINKVDLKEEERNRKNNKTCINKQKRHIHKIIYAITRRDFNNNNNKNQRMKQENSSEERENEQRIRKEEEKNTQRF